MRKNNYRRRASTSALLVIGLVAVTAGSVAARPVTAPTVTHISPASGVTGSTVKVSGRNLKGAQVSFKGVRSPRVTVDATGAKATAVVPPGVPVGTVKVVVTTKGGTASTTFKVLPIP